jgi:hypothetical protein
VPQEPSLFLDAAGERILVDCAVLYLDVLGVSARSRGPDAQRELRDFDDAIRRAFTFPLGSTSSGDEAVYPSAVFSDSYVAVVASQKGLTSSPRADVVSQLAFDAASIQAVLALRDYSVRGAITLGKCHFHGGLVFGPALVEAVELESTRAVDPRILLSPGAVEALREGKGESVSREPILVDEDGLAFVSYLEQLYGDPRAERGAEQLASHRDVVSVNLERYAADMHRWRKHRWLAEYHNEFCRRHAESIAAAGVTVDSLLITRLDSNRSFRDLPPTRSA